METVIINDIFSESKDVIQRMEVSGDIDVFIASGRNAEYAEKYLRNIPLVRVEFTGYDIMNAVKESMAFSDSIALITSNALPQLEELREVFRAEVRPYVYKTLDELQLLLQTLYAEGIRDVIGTSLVIDQAKIYGMRGHYIWSLDGVRRAMETAINLVRNRKALAEKARLLDYLMDYSAEGIIVTDRNGIITHFNNSAERIIGRSRKSIVGRPCEEVLPNTQLHTVIREKRAQFNKVQDLGNVKIVTNRSPIISDKEVIGALATFFSGSTINQAGENVRRSQSFNGFLAKGTFAGIRTVSPEFAAIKEKAERYARSDVSVFIQGETGTGKEVFAQALHNASLRKNEHFVHINCGAIPSSKLEGELFGCDDISNGRRVGRMGLLEMAYQGTCFFDEIGELPLKLQARLLSAIEEKQFFRMGSNKVVPVDVRLIASSRKDLYQLVQEGLFREDLYYRIHVLELQLPNLSQRKCDIPLLIKEFLYENRNDLTHSEMEAISQASRFLDYDWPGNIRQLRNVIERFCVNFTPGTDIDSAIEDVLVCRNPSEEKTPSNEDVERQEIKDALRLAFGSRAQAADILGISRTTLWRKMRELGMADD